MRGWGGCEDADGTAVGAVATAGGGGGTDACTAVGAGAAEGVGFGFGLEVFPGVAAVEGGMVEVQEGQCLGLETEQNEKSIRKVFWAQ